MRGENLKAEQVVFAQWIEQDAVLHVELGAFRDVVPVSYTHLDVYKRQLYARFARRYNLMLATPPQSDAATRFSEPFKGGDFAYNYLIGEGSRPLAFVRFSRNPHDTMDVQEAFFDGYEGLNALLGYLARFTAEFATIAITLPRGVPLSSLVENPYALKSAPEHSYMARVTNAAAALALLRPEEPFTVEVCDQFLPENSEMCIRDRGISKGRAV